MVLHIFALCFFGFGMLALGFYAGEGNIIRHDRRKNIFRSEDPNNWWFMGTISIVIAIVLAIIAVNPVEKLKERADQIRSSTTSETTIR